MHQPLQRALAYLPRPASLLPSPRASLTARTERFGGRNALVRTGCMPSLSPFPNLVLLHCSFSADHNSVMLAALSPETVTPAWESMSVTESESAKVWPYGSE